MNIPAWHFPRRRTLTFTLWLVCLFALLSLTSTTVWAQTPTPDVDPARVDGMSIHLLETFAATDESVSFLVILKDQLDLDSIPELADASSVARAEDLYSSLTAHASTTQADIRTFLAEREAPFRPYYIVNMLAVEGDAQLADDLLARDDVDRLEANPEIPQSILSGANTAPDYGWARVLNFSTAETTLDMPYGLIYTHADEVWDMGYTGQGVVVASQDTGVEWTHPALQPRYRGWDSATATADHVYNWFDAWDLTGRPGRCEPDAQIPCDDHGHGTHTVGTMLGNAQGTQPQVGMAPGADWIGCRNMHNGLGTPGSYTACFEFFLAPYPQGGDPFTDGVPTKAPHIINNSWGCPPSEGCDVDTLRQVVETMRVAGQFVITSAGNHGNACSTVQDPTAIYDAVFSIGAHNSSGDLAGFSSRGPVTVDGSGRLKPDIAAPGVAVYSSGTNNSYYALQGTSMASPHVAGAVALLWSAAPELIGDIDLSEQLLLKSATQMFTSACNPDGESSAPNNLYGYGELNALQTVEMALEPVTVTVTITQSFIPIATDDTVVLVDDLTGHRYLPTAREAGGTIFTPVYAGEYAVALMDNDNGEVGSRLATVVVNAGGEDVAISVALSRALFLPIVANSVRFINP